MRILYICNEYPPAVHGGIGVFVQTLAEKLAALRHDIAVIGYASNVRASNESVEKGVRVLRLPWPRGGRVLGLGFLRIDSAAVAARKNLSREAARFARAFLPDLVESHDWSGPLWTPPGRTLVVRLHGASSVLKVMGARKPSQLMRFIERRNVRMADGVISASRFIGKSTMDVLGLREKPFSTVYHGIDTNYFRPSKSSRGAKEILFVGTVKNQKGIRELFEAIPRILEAEPEACFTIAGRYPEDPDDPCSPQSLLRMRSTGQGPGPVTSGPPRDSSAHIRFLGQVPRQELPQLYCQAAAAVFPSHGEAFGLACGEAMSCGAAVVAANHGSAGELITDGESGLLVEPRNSGALAAAVVRLLDDAELRRRLGAAARSRMVENFHLDDAVARNLAFYKQVVSRFPDRQIVHA
jgi:glycosyltransferase involved in cell wall biosynthesis